MLPPCVKTTSKVRQLSYTTILLLAVQEVIGLESRASQYTSREFLQPPELAWAAVNALSDDGVGIGYGRDVSNTGTVPIVWNVPGKPTQLPTYGATRGGAALSIDGAGRIVGALALLPDGSFVPGTWSGGSFTQLPSPPGLGRALAARGNVIVGHVRADGRDVPAVWVDDQLTVLDHLPGWYGAGSGVNNLGTYVGVLIETGSDGFLKYSSFVGQGGDAHLLNLPLIEQPHALDINDSGTIAGWWTDNLGFRHSFTVADNGDAPPVELGLLPGRVEGYAQGLNNHGDVAGINLDVSFNETAVVYFGGSTVPVDMNTLIDPIPGVHLVRGVDINDAGQILVEGASPQGYRYYILTPVPVPEPAGVALFMLSAAGFRRWRNKTGNKTRTG